MHYLDELIALYQGRDPFARKYLLSTLARLPIRFDSTTLIDFLWQELGESDHAIRHQARIELGRALPVHLRHEYALEGPRRGVWSSYMNRAQLMRHLEEEALQQLPPEQVAPLVNASMLLLAPSLDWAVRHLESGNHRIRQAASLALGRVQTSAGLEAAAARIAAGKAGFGDAAALAELGGDEAHRLLLDITERWSTKQPDLVMLLRGVAPARAQPLLEAFEAATDAYGRGNVAQACAPHAVPGAHEMLVRLLGRQEGWVSVFALDALWGRARAEDLALIRSTCTGAKHEFVRVQAVRLCGTVASPESSPFLLECLTTGTPRVQAAALEALAMRLEDSAELTRAAEPALKSELLKTRVNAIMVLARADPERVGAPIQRLLLSSRAVTRLEGAFVLGYVAGPESTRTLVEIANADPEFAVRLQAVKSLAKQPGEFAVDGLLFVLQNADHETASIAIRALTACGAEQIPAVQEALEKQAAETAVPARKAHLLRAIGALAARQPIDGPPAALVAALASPEPAVQLGALEGLRFLGDSGYVPEMEPFLMHENHSMRARASIAGFLSGELDALAGLESLVASTDEEAIKTGLRSLLEVAVILPAAMKSVRFARLRTKVTAERSNIEADHIFSRADSRLDVPPASKPKSENAIPLSADTWRSAKDGFLAASGHDLRAQYQQQLKEEPRPEPEPSQPTTKEPTGNFHVSKVPLSRPVKKPAGRPSIDVDEVSYMVGLPTVAKTFLERTKGYNQLLAIPLVLALPFALWLARLNQATPIDPNDGKKMVRLGAIPPGKLRAMSLRGNVRIGPDGGKKAERGDEAQAKDHVSTLEGEVRLLDARSNSVWLGPNSDLDVVGSVTGKSPYLFLEPEGDVMFDYKSPAEFEVRCGKTRVIAKGASLRVRGIGLARTLSLMKGEAEVEPGGKLALRKELACPKVLP